MTSAADTSTTTSPASSESFKWGVSEELVAPTVNQGLASVPGLRRGRTAAWERAPVLPVDDAIVDATLPHMPEVVADMVRLQRLTGMRPAEVCIIRPCDVTRSGKVWLYKPASHKTEHHGRDRVVFLGAEAQGVLLPYLARGVGRRERRGIRTMSTSTAGGWAS